MSVLQDVEKWTSELSAAVRAGRITKIVYEGLMKSVEAIKARANALSDADPIEAVADSTELAVDAAELGGEVAAVCVA